MKPEEAENTSQADVHGLVADLNLIAIHRSSAARTMRYPWPLV